MTQQYQGQEIALLTQHGKERVIAPVLNAALGCSVIRVDGYDTDLLGTFTRETPRPGSQLDAARRKARLGMELSGHRVGLASEGSFGPDPFTGMFAWNTEILVLIDDRLGIEVTSLAQGPGKSAHVITGDWEALDAFARREGFPEHHLVLRPSSEDDPRVHKGIGNWATLRCRFDQCLRESPDARVFAELDLRAFANPTRMQRIEEAAHDLLRRLRSACPACGLPGFAAVERIAGLPCAGCGRPTTAYRAERWQCVSCPQTTLIPRTDLTESPPQHCPYCNP
jgi:hypothetical protein